MNALGIKILSYICIGLLLTQVASGFYIHFLRADLKAETKAKELAEANDKQCQKDKLITSEASNDYQKNLAALNSKLANLKRVRSNPRCIPITR